MTQNAEYQNSNQFSLEQVLHSSNIKFLIETHELSLKLENLVNLYDARVICGELTVETLLILLNHDLNDIPTQSKIDAVLNNGTGITEDNLDKSISVLERQVAAGKSFWTTDGTFDYALERNNDFPSLFYDALYTGIILSAVPLDIGAYLAVLDKNNFPSRREFLKLATANTAFGALLIAFRGGLTGENYAVEAKRELQERINKPEFISNIDALVPLRNIVMVLNMKHMLALYKDETSKDQKVFFAANGHHDVEDKMDQDHSELEEELSDYSDKLIDITLTVLMGESELNNEQIADILLIYAKLFSQPSEFGRNAKSFDLPTMSKDMPLTACSVLISKCIVFLNSTPTNSDFDSEKRVIIKNFIYKFLSQIDFENDQLVKKINEDFQMPEATLIKPIIHDSEFTKTYTFDINSELSFKGVGILYGRSVPILELQFNGQNVTCAKLDRTRYVQII